MSKATKKVGKRKAVKPRATKAKKPTKDKILEALRVHFGTAEWQVDAMKFFKEMEERKQKFVDENKEAWRKQRDELFRTSPPVVHSKEKILRDLNVEKLDKTLAFITDVLSNSKISKFGKVVEISRIIEAAGQLCEEIQVEKS